MQAGKSQHARMLQVALGPTAIARRVVDDVRRHFLPAADELRELAHFVTRATHERGFDEVMAQYRSTQWRLSGQTRQRAVTGEGLQAQECVVAPVGALPQLPERAPAREHRASHPRPNLQQTSE